MEEKYLNDKNTSETRKNAVRRLRMMYKPKTLYETDPFNSEGDTSYTINTGEMISLCIRKWDDDEQKYLFHDMNTLMYVTFHELAHVAANEVEHPNRFWRVFKWLLQNGIDMGLYTVVDYKRHPILYCKSLSLDSNIMFGNVSTFE